MGSASSSRPARRPACSRKPNRSRTSDSSAVSRDAAVVGMQALTFGRITRSASGTWETRRARASWASALTALLAGVCLELPPRSVFLYFGYGSNLHVPALRAKGVRPVASVRGRLRGWRLAFDVRHWFPHEGGMGNIRRTDDVSDEVQGVVHACE